MERKNNHDNFMMQGTILAVASVVVRVIGMIYRIPLNRIIGDVGMGLYGGAFEVYNIALLLSSYSLPLAVSKLVADRSARGERRNAFRVFKSALLFAACVGLLMCLLILILAGPIATHIMNSPMSAYPLRVLAPCLFIVAIMGVIRGFFQGQGTMVPTALSQVIEQIVNAIVSVTAGYYLFRAGTEAARTSALDNADMLGAAYGASGGTLGTATGAFAGLIFLGIVLFVSRRGIRRAVLRDKDSRTEGYLSIYRVLLLTIMPVLLSSALYNICGILDQSVFNHMMARQGIPYRTYTEWIGMYTGKYLLLINIPLAMANALAASSMPSLTKSIAMQERRSIIFEKIQKTVRFGMLIAIPCAIGFLVMASPILQLLFHDDRKKMAYILMIGAVCVVFYSLSTITNAILQGLNRMRDPLKNAAISLAIHVVLLFLFLLTGMRIYGVVVANTLFSVTMCILNQIDIHKTIGYRQEYQKTFIKPLIAAAIMGAATRLLYMLLHLFTGNAVSTILSLVFAVVLYALLLLLTGTLSGEDLEELPKGARLASVARRLHLLREDISDDGK